MESNMVEDYFDNERAMNGTEAILYIQNYFKNELPEFQLKNKYIDPGGYWGIEFYKAENIVKFESGRGILEPFIEINETRYSLSQFDIRMKKIKTSSKTNILFTLETIKKIFQ